MATKRDVKKEHYNLGYALDEKKKIEVLKEMFKRRVGYELNLENPRSMNEKIMWFKLYYQDPLITKCSDKFAVKEYVTEKVGEQYIVPNIAAWDSPEQIDFDSLPDKFVLKVNWSSGYNIIVRDKSELDREATVKKIKAWLKPDRNSYYQYFNWGYKHMKPVVYAEPYIEQMAGQVYDYKFYFCNGEFKYMFIATDRYSKESSLTYTFFDENFEKIPCTYGNKPNADPAPEMPHNLHKMLEIAKKLAEPFPFVRVDFYEVDENTIYLGEMTFYSGGGTLPFDPVEWDYNLGEKIILPEKRIIDKEDLIFKIRSATKKASLKIKNKYKKWAKKIRHKIVHKHTYKTNKYLVVFGIRIPYETHLEAYPNINKKYIRILGLEVCYKKLPKAKPTVNTNTKFAYKPNTPLNAFMLEDKITPEIQRIHCEQKAYKQLGYFPNLTEPKSLNEKILWLALNYKNPEISPATDKGKAKDWIADRVGAEYVVPAIGVYDDVNKIDFENLPNQFVAKLNDGWGADKVMIIRNKESIDIDKTKAVLSSWLYPWNNYYYQNMCITDEKMEKPTIIIEEYLENEGSKELDDFKFYCCNGEPKFALVVNGRGTAKQSRSFVDMDWEVLPVARNGKPSNASVEKPECYDEMIRLCRTLSKGFPFVRVDLYQVDGKVYVGEMTFTPGMFLKFNPKEWDFKLGEYLELPDLNV